MTLTFRASPFIELKRLDDLPPAQREPLRELEEDPAFHGLFVAKPPLAMNLKSVTRPVAELFRALETPARLDPIDDEVIDLVLDGILEVDSGADFVSGADALPFWSAVATPSLSNGVDALRYAQDLVTTDPQELAMALYCYNRIPLTPFWRGRFATPESIVGPLRLERDWIAAHDSPGWFGWISRAAAHRGGGDVPWKLYVSPRPERIRDAFEAFVRTLSGFPGAAFKIANSAAGLMRPDKLVAYFSSREELDAAADALRRELGGCDAQGVPFTAPLDESGLLSWGVDPPESERALRWTQRESWRLWLVQRLGAAMAIARAARTVSAVEPWLFAIERVRRHGVDVETWTPSAALWSGR